MVDTAWKALHVAEREKIEADVAQTSRHDYDLWSTENGLKENEQRKRIGELVDEMVQEQELNGLNSRGLSLFRPDQVWNGNLDNYSKKADIDNLIMQDNRSGIGRR